MQLFLEKVFFGLITTKNDNNPKLSGNKQLKKMSLYSESRYVKSEHEEWEP